MEHIVIVGAGASGLMAASLLSAEFNVTVVEARDRIGGRIHTIKDPFSKPSETGAEFVHGEQPLTLSILRENKIKTRRLTGKMFNVKDDQLSKQGFFDDGWEELNEKLQSLDQDTDLAAFLNRNFSEPKYADLVASVRGFVEGYDAADINEVSAFALRDEWAETDDEDQHHIDGGYGELIDVLKSRMLSSGGKVMLNSLVERIAWSKGEVRLSGPGLDLSANRVIITVPLGVLHAESLRFVPDISLQNSFSDIGFGGVIKFLFEFKEPIWENAKNRKFEETAFIFSDAEIPTWWTQRPDERPLLTGWLGGPKTFAQVHSNDLLFKKAVDSLRYITKLSQQEIEGALRCWHIQDWVSDPLSRGAYAYNKVKSEHAKKRITTPISDTIYFAGEALYTGPAMGTVEAALQSGKEVAEKLLSGKH